MREGAPAAGAGGGVREATEADLPSLAADLAGLPLLRQYGTEAEVLARSLAAARRRGDGLLVADCNGRSAALAWFLTEGTLALGGYLRLIAVRPGYEGRGLGSLLLDAVERRTAARSRNLFLLCSAGNHEARRFYARHGYREGGVLPGLVKPDLDEVLLWKRLDRLE